jgi:hypothetical protein
MSNFDWTQTEALLEKNIRYIENSKKINADISKLRQLNEVDYRVLLCQDGVSCTIEKKTEKGFLRLHSAYEPQREGKLLAEKIIGEGNEGKLYVRFGFGLGYLYNYLLPLIDSQGGELVVYEPSYDIFNYFIRLFDISAIFKGRPVRLFVRESGDFVSDIYPYSTGDKAKTYSQTILGYLKFFESEIEKCTKALTDFYLRGSSNRATKRSYGHKWAKNFILNIPSIFKSYGHMGLCNLLNGKPAIIVSAGPSLNKNIHLLKEVQGKVFIISAYSAIKTLEANDIKPDLFIWLRFLDIPNIRRGNRAFINFLKPCFIAAERKIKGKHIYYGCDMLIYANLQYLSKFFSITRHLICRS